VRKLKQVKYCKNPRRSSKSGDITGGLPRITELLEARNPSNPCFLKLMVVSLEKEVNVRLLSNLNLVMLENT
jgi:hypothetical protein